MKRRLKKLVAFYSLEGNTRAIAQAMADEIGADLLEIKPIDEVPAKGFVRFMRRGMRVIMGRVPQLEPFGVDPREYDLILIGSPVWAQSIAPPIRAFLTQTHLKHKAVAFFSTHKGGVGKALVQMRKAAVGADVLGETDFANVLRSQDETLPAARAWARKMLETLTHA